MARPPAARAGRATATSAGDPTSRKETEWKEVFQRLAKELSVHLGSGIFCHLSLRHGHINFSILDPSSVSAPQHQEASFYCRKSYTFQKKRFSTAHCAASVTLFDFRRSLLLSVRPKGIFYWPVTLFTFLSNYNDEEKLNYCKDSTSASHRLPILKSKGRVEMIQSCGVSSTSSQRH